MKLIVEEAGRRRGFRVGQGVLVVGSGPEARLRLAGADVAARHARLEVGPDGARIVPEAGVLPPELDGVPVGPEGCALAPGRKLRIGGALLWLEADGSDPGPAERGASARPVRAPSTPPSAPRSVVRRTRRPARKGLPAWGVSTIAVLVVGAALLVLWQAFELTAERAAPDAEQRLVALRAVLERGDVDRAAARLADIDPEDLAPAQRASYDELRARIEELQEGTRRVTRREEGERLLAWLREFEEESLAGTPDVARVRLFLKRARRFREEYPTHPDMDWVERQEARFAGLVDLDAPPDWESVRYESRSLIRSAPRNYAAAFALVEDFLARDDLPERERDEALRYRRLLEEERREYHEDRMEAARGYWNEGNEGRAVWWLVHEVIWNGDEEMEDEAARVLLKFPEVEAHLRGYRDEMPAKYEQLAQNEEVRRFLRARGGLDG